MKFKTPIFATLLFLGLTAASHADQVVSQAYEVSLDNFRAPATENGGVSFKECDSCDRKVVRVSEGTRYTVNGKAVMLEDFRKAIASASDRSKTWLTVLHHLESDTIKMVAVSL